MPVNLLADAQGVGGVDFTAQGEMGGIVDLCLLDVDSMGMLFALVGVERVMTMHGALWEYVTDQEADASYILYLWCSSRNSGMM